MTLHKPEADREPQSIYPRRTRVTHHVAGAICSSGYAVSQQGARRLLYGMGVAEFDLEYDNMLRKHCEGVNGRTRGNCLTVQRPLSDDRRPAGYASSHSDIANHGQCIVDKPSTNGIRWSTRVNS